MSDIWELINGGEQPLWTMESHYAWSDLLNRFVGLGSYTAAVFVFGYLMARARWAARFETQRTSSSQESDAVNAALACDRILAEIRQEIETHSDSPRRLDKQLDTSDRYLICDHAKVARTENSEFQQFLDDRCSQLELHSEQRGGTLKSLFKSIVGESAIWIGSWRNFKTAINSSLRSRPCVSAFEICRITTNACRPSLTRLAR